jgi:hypothetical protein
MYDIHFKTFSIKMYVVFNYYTRNVRKTKINNFFCAKTHNLIGFKTNYLGILP